MPITDELGHEVAPAPSFARLRDRSWGIRVHDSLDRTGQTIEVARHSRGDSTTVRLTERVALYRSDTRPALYRFEDTTPRPSTDDAAPAGATLPVPVAANRTGRMLLAGGIHATITHPDGLHTTLRISSRRRTGRGWANCAPTDEGATVSIRVGATGRILPGWHLQMFGASQHARDAVQALFQVASGADVQLIGGRLALADGYRIQVADRCGRCHRELTDPVSIDRGIGPECWGHSTGSRHAPVIGASTAPSPSIAAPAAPDQSLAALLADDDIEDEADAYMAQHPAADAPAPAPFEVVGAVTYDAADDSLTAQPPVRITNAFSSDPITTEPAITGADIALARNAIQAAFRSRTPRQLRALDIFDQLAARIDD